MEAMESRGAVIRLESLTKRYGRVLALDGLNMEVLPGEVLGFLGPNGAGKTTTLRLLMGHLRPTWTPGGTGSRCTPGPGICLVT